MDRYYTEDLFFRPLKRIFIKGKKTENHGGDEKIHTVTTTDLLSFLYIDNINDVGKRKEYVLRGKVLDIKAYKNYNVRNVKQPGFSTYSHMPEEDVRVPYAVDNTSIILDCSSVMKSDIRKLKVSNILDVQPVDYPWDLNEILDLVPREGDGLKFYEPERWGELIETHPTKVSDENYW